MSPPSRLISILPEHATTSRMRNAAAIRIIVALGALRVVRLRVALEEVY